MPRTRRILKEHILDAALELMKEEGFNRFTARRIAECLNASTQPIYKEFNNMDDLKENLLEYIIEFLKKDIFLLHTKDVKLEEVCINYIRFAKEEGTLFSALYMGRELPAHHLHTCVHESLHKIALNHDELKNKDEKDRQFLLDIIWPSIHGVAILTAQKQVLFETEEELSNKVTRIVTHSLKVWEKYLAA